MDTAYTWKHTALISVIASTYVLSKTSNDYKDFFSYGNRMDDEGKPTFVMDLPYIGQICVHFGWDEMKQTILDSAKKQAETILEQKVKLGQITERKYGKIISELDKEGILPEYKGKFYEYNTGIPIEYVGERFKKARKIIDNKLPENIIKKDLNKLKTLGFNDREIYYFCIKIGAPEKVLIRAKELAKDLEVNNIENRQSMNNRNYNRDYRQLGNNRNYNRIGKQSIDNAIDNITIGEYKNANNNLYKLKNRDKDRDENRDRYDFDR